MTENLRTEKTNKLAYKGQVFMPVHGSENKILNLNGRGDFYLILNYVSWLKPSNQSKCFSSESITVIEITSLLVSAYNFSSQRVNKA